MLIFSKNLLTGKRGIMYYWGNEDEEFLKRWKRFYWDVLPSNWFTSM